MENSEKGAKRKCTKCGILFFDFGKFPLTCPSCGTELNSLLTNISKRGRPPKNVQPEVVPKEKNLEIEDISVEEQSDDQDNDDDVSSVDDIVEIERDEE
jgi:uncharacterized protein (TIGR02300 family)